MTGLEHFRNEYLQLPTESPEHAAQRELAEHCVDLIDEFEDERYGPPREDYWTGPFSRARQDCRRYTEEVKDEIFSFASRLAPLDHHEWNQMVLWATREKSQRMDRRKKR